MEPNIPKEIVMTEKRWMTIHFNDSSEMKFIFPKQTDDATNIVTDLNKLLESNHLLVEAEGIFYSFPFANIKYIRVSPSPEQVPATLIKGAVLKEG
jgi:hypothetical protein